MKKTLNQQYFHFCIVYIIHKKIIKTMKHSNYLCGIIIFLFVIFATACTSTEDPTVNSSSKTAGTLSVNVTTSTYNGKYTPAHVLAIWIESNSGTFVKSLLIKAQARKQYLTNWNSSSAGNTVDAVTGATLSSHAQRTCTWDGKDAKGNVVGDGIYKVCMEFTENDGTGKFTAFIFTKGTAPDSQTPANKNNFNNISLVWTPAQ